MADKRENQPQPTTTARSFAEGVTRGAGEGLRDMTDPVAMVRTARKTVDTARSAYKRYKASRSPKGRGRE
jgi:hypothetical protein